MCITGSANADSEICATHMKVVDMKLLTTENSKTIKGEKMGWLTGILYLAPAKVSGHNVCPHSDKACRAACLFTAGRGVFPNVMHSRIRKTRWLFKDRKGFIDQIKADIRSLQTRAKHKGMQLAIRLNGTSDLPWESAAYGRIPQQFPDTVFYDYTANLTRVLDKPLPKNYSLVFSRKVTNADKCMCALQAGTNVAVVFDEVPVGEHYWGHKVVDGDLNDLRFLEHTDENNEAVIVGLKAKGRARHDRQGFVVSRASCN